MKFHGMKIRIFNSYLSCSDSYKLVLKSKKFTLYCKAWHILRTYIYIYIHVYTQFFYTVFLPDFEITPSTNKNKYAFLHEFFNFNFQIWETKKKQPLITDFIATKEFNIGRSNPRIVLGTGDISPDDSISGAVRNKRGRLCYPLKSI